MTSTPIDQAVGDGDATPATPTGSPSFPFGDPTAAAPAAPVRAPVRQLTIDEVLKVAKTPEKHARVCLAADLQATYDNLVAELATLVNAQGEVIDDGEASAADGSNAARAQELSDQMARVRTKMTKSMWFPLFRGLASEDLAVFNKKHLPAADKDGDRDTTEYYNLLIAECSIDDPKITVEKARQLRKVLGVAAMNHILRTIDDVCARGGVDLPFSSTSWGNRTR